ncbi:MAG: hypothetical protein IJ192_03705 [Clostridia bacterium]|nr:hypothetical protein [Clostridia bacterium]MBR2175798.1 hypothetical protein [Clostridia bacterium]
MSERKDLPECVEVKLVGGEYFFTLQKNIVGYCHFSEHKGYITKNILKNRKCAKKGCYYFEKYADNPYWLAIQRIEAAEKRQKEAAKQIKKKNEDKQEQLIETVQKIADDFGYHMKVLRVSKNPCKKEYIVFYISDNSYDDWYKFINIARKFGAVIGCRIELRHAKDANGHYATI